MIFKKKLLLPTIVVLLSAAILATNIALAQLNEYGEDPNEKYPTENGLVSQKEYLQIILNFQHILNNKLPNRADIMYLYSDAEADREVDLEFYYCEVLGKLQRDTKEMSDCLMSLIPSFPPPSLYLVNMKNIITDGRNVPVKIFIDPRLKTCPEKGVGTGANLYMDAIAIMPGKYKKLGIGLTCDVREKWGYKIYDIKIDDKWLDDYPFTIPYPAPWVKRGSDEK